MLLSRDPSHPLSMRALKVGGQTLVTKTKLPSPTGIKKKNNINFNPKVGRFNIKPSAL